MARSTTKDAQVLIHSLRSAHSAIPTSTKIIDHHVAFAVSTALIQLIEKAFLFKEDFAPLALPATEGYIFQQLPADQILTAIDYIPYKVVYISVVGSFPFNSFLSGVLSCVGTAVLAVCLRIQVNKDNKEFKDLPPEGAFADFILCNLVLHLTSLLIPFTQRFGENCQIDVSKTSIIGSRGDLLLTE